MQYESISLDNGLRIIHLPGSSPVAYCGFAVNAGTRDEQTEQYGLAHFVEHMLFKGTKKRKAWHILNRMENVGGELNAYTTKEETFLYSVCMAEDIERAMELLADLLLYSQFPPAEIEKEKEVVIDEINSYKDSPTELIFDEFEDLLFAGNQLGHNILGEPETLKTFNTADCKSFVQNYYSTGNMIFFSYGKVPFPKIQNLAKKYFIQGSTSLTSLTKREIPEVNPVRKKEVSKNLHQTHVMLGGRAYDNRHENRIGLYLLNNILGGPGMNSRLNISLREKNGLVYNVESGLTSYTDCGLFAIYFGCDHESKNRCLRLTLKELKRLRENELTTSQLSAYVKQLKGQLGISSDHRENRALALGKSFLHFNEYDDLPKIYKKLDALTSSKLLEIANEIFDEDKLSLLIYK